MSATMPEPATRALGGAELESVSAFLFHEAALLDEQRYSEWLALFDDDGTYWVPQSRDGGDPARQVSIIYDDRTRIGDRVTRLESGDAYAQIPASQTCRMVGNVTASAARDLVTANATVMVTEFRRDQQKIYAGRYQFDLVAHGDLWKIKAKVVRLVNADAPLGNLSILL